MMEENDKRERDNERKKNEEEREAMRENRTVNIGYEKKDRKKKTWLRILQKENSKK